MALLEGRSGALGSRSARGELRAHWRSALALAVMALAVVVAKGFFAGRLILNRTPSVPRGIYWLSPGAPPERGKIVAFPIPDYVAALFRERALVPSAFFSLLAKPVAAVVGDNVCIREHHLYVNAQLVATVRDSDSHGRPLPHVEICRPLEQSEVFVLTSQESFDSRYLGPIPTAAVRGTMTSLLEF